MGTAVIDAFDGKLIEKERNQSLAVDSTALVLVVRWAHVHCP